MERKIFICDCHNLEHQVSFWYDEEDKLLYIEPHLVTHRNFFKRLWVGIKYAFGYKSRFGEFDEILLSPENQKKLVDMLNLPNRQVKKYDPPITHMEWDAMSVEERQKVVQKEIDKCNEKNERI